MQATKLTSSDRTAIEVSLARLVGDAFGSLATLPLYCTDQLPSADPRSIVLDHFDVWRSCLIVIREVLKSEGFSTDEMPRGVGELMSELTRLGGAYLAIQATQKDMPKKAVEAFELLESAYRRIPQLVRELGT